MKFHVIGSFEPPLPSKSSIIELVEHGGGKNVKSLDTCKKEDEVIVIVDEFVGNEPSTHVQFYWILDSISCYSLQPFEKYRLFMASPPVGGRKFF